MNILYFIARPPADIGREPQLELVAGVETDDDICACVSITEAEFRAMREAAESLRE